MIMQGGGQVAQQPQQQQINVEGPFTDSTGLTRNICRIFFKSGICRWGSNCKFAHLLRGMGGDIQCVNAGQVPQQQQQQQQQPQQQQAMGQMMQPMQQQPQQQPQQQQFVVQQPAQGMIVQQQQQQGVVAVVAAHTGRRPTAVTAEPVKMTLTRIKEMLGGLPVDFYGIAGTIRAVSITLIATGKLVFKLLYKKDDILVNTAFAGDGELEEELEALLDMVHRDATMKVAGKNVPLGVEKARHLAKKLRVLMESEGISKVTYEYDGVEDEQKTPVKEETDDKVVKAIENLGKTFKQGSEQLESMIGKKFEALEDKTPSGTGSSPGSGGSSLFFNGMKTPGSAASSGLGLVSTPEAEAALLKEKEEEAEAKKYRTELAQYKMELWTEAQKNLEAEQERRKKQLRMREEYEKALAREKTIADEKAALKLMKLERQKDNEIQAAMQKAAMNDSLMKRMQAEGEALLAEKLELEKTRTMNVDGMRDALKQELAAEKTKWQQKEKAIREAWAAASGGDEELKKALMLDKERLVAEKKAYEERCRSQMIAYKKEQEEILCKEKLNLSAQYETAKAALAEDEKEKLAMRQQEWENAQEGMKAEMEQLKLIKEQQEEELARNKQALAEQAAGYERQILAARDETRAKADEVLMRETRLNETLRAAATTAGGLSEKERAALANSGAAREMTAVAPVTAAGGLLPMPAAATAPIEQMGQDRMKKAPAQSARRVVTTTSSLAATKGAILASKKKERGGIQKITPNKNPKKKPRRLSGPTEQDKEGLVARLDGKFEGEDMEEDQDEEGRSDDEEELGDEGTSGFAISATMPDDFEEHDQEERELQLYMTKQDGKLQDKENAGGLLGRKEDLSSTSLFGDDGFGDSGVWTAPSVGLEKEDDLEKEEEKEKTADKRTTEPRGLLGMPLGSSGLFDGFGEDATKDEEQEERTQHYEAGGLLGQDYYQEEEEEEENDWDKAQKERMTTSLRAQKKQEEDMVAKKKEEMRKQQEKDLRKAEKIGESSKLNQMKIKELEEVAKSEEEIWKGCRGPSKYEPYVASDPFNDVDREWVATCAKVPMHEKYKLEQELMGEWVKHFPLEVIQRSRERVTKIPKWWKSHASAWSIVKELLAGYNVMWTGKPEHTQMSVALAICIEAKLEENKLRKAAEKSKSKEETKRRTA